MAYALISAIEHDLRRMLRKASLDDLALEAVLTEDVAARARERRTRELGIKSDQVDLADLLDYLDYSDALDSALRNKDRLSPAVSRYIGDEQTRLRALAPIRNRVMHSRPLLATDLPTTLDTARTTHGALSDTWLDVGEVLERLEVDSSWVLGVQIPLEEDTSDVLHNLPSPDFDETGFIGRTDEVEAVRDAILGSFPVVSILGEGGAGKSAVAVKAAYDLLDQRDVPFEAIVWSTAKTAALTGAEIRRVEGAITDTLGLLRVAASELGAPVNADPTAELLSYLRQFRVLLILDNLETVLDERMRAFLTRMPRGSKALITSRLGLGSLEVPIKLGPMIERDAISLMRSTAEVRQVQELVRMGNPRVAGYCERLKRNPGLMKWFVAGVQAGRRPEELLARPDDFLQFCMENVYDSLGSDAKEVLAALQVVQTPMSQPELHFLLGVDDVQLQMSVQQLLTTNMVVQRTMPLGNSYQTRYEVTELARLYLVRQHPASAEQRRAFQERRAQLRALRQEVDAESRLHPYEPSTVRPRNPDDLATVKLLREAMRLCKAKQYGEARERAMRARALAPDYYETYRVCGFIAAESGDVGDAIENYSLAEEHGPDQPSVHYFRAGFLLQALDDLEGAVKAYREALKLDPASPEIMLGLARALIISREFTDGRHYLDHAATSPGLDERRQRMVHALRVQSYLREAETLLDTAAVVGAIDCLDRALGAFDAVPPHLRDSRLRRSLERASSIPRRCVVEVARRGFDAAYGERAQGLAERFQAITGARPVAVGDGSDDVVLLGSVDNIRRDGSFGFVESDNGERHFFHRSRLADPGTWTTLYLGTRVAYRLGANERGPCAVALEVMPDDEDREFPYEVGRWLAGVIKTLSPEHTFGFISTEMGREFYFHESALEAPLTMPTLRAGEPVDFRVGPVDHRGIHTEAERVRRIE